jgi:hypothetical protein
VRSSDLWKAISLWQGIDACVTNANIRPKVLQTGNFFSVKKGISVYSDVFLLKFLRIVPMSNFT